MIALTASPKSRRPRILAPLTADSLKAPPAKRRRRRRGSSSDGSDELDQTPRRRAGSSSATRRTQRFASYSEGRIDFPRAELKAAERIKALDGSFLSCFFTKAYIFSNHFSRKNGLITVDGMNFICTEQYYMYYKARVFGDMATAQEVMLAPDARSMKKLGSSVENFDLMKWRRVALTVMVIASLRKYEQNEDLRKLLFETEDTTIVETSPGDNYWGVGLFMNDPLVKDRSKWKGKNVLGRILMNVRGVLMARAKNLDC